ncbi:hypothetical protein [Cohnella sp. GCM10027633]|uniref:hypothetical protein n=1 Tax=unclassified Cohnella TaxID=2636738 RepID=UPI003636D7E0
MKYIIFGAGKYAEKTIQAMSSRDFLIECVVDNNQARWGSSLFGLQIKSPALLNEWQKQNMVVFVSVAGAVPYREIANQLAELGMAEDRDFFSAVKMFNLADVPNGWVSGHVSLPEEFESIKTFDNQSRLIVRKDEKKIYRAVNTKHADLYQKVYEKCFEYGLLQEFVVDTKVADRITGIPFDYVLEHQFVEPISYCSEWSPQTFRAYVNFMIRFIKKLDEASLALKDGHTLNATFYKGKFVFLDFGALDEGKTTYPSMMDFINTHITPLLLINKNQIAKAYLFLKNPGLTYTLTDIIGYLDQEEIEEYNKLIGDCFTLVTAGRIAEFCDRLLHYCTGLPFNLLSSKWAGYQDEEWGSLHNEDGWVEKSRNTVELVRQVRPRTLIDLAGNMGWYGAVLSDQLEYSIIADLDYSCIDYLFNKIVSSNGEFSNIIPTNLNIITPTPNYYRDDVIGSTGIIPWRKSAFERFRCEMAMAISVVHHLAFSQQLTFMEIIQQFKLFTSRYLIVEFIKQEDEYISDFLKAGFDWYTEDAFLQALETEFTILTTRPSTPSITRTLYLCEIKLQS